MQPAEAAPATPAPARVVVRLRLGGWSRRVLRALAEVMMPSRPPAPPPSIGAAVDFIDDYTRYFPRLLRLLFPVGLLVFELSALVLAPSLVPFSAMSLERRRAYVARWTHARGRMRRDLMKALRGLFLFYYYSQPEAGAALGYNVEEFVDTVKKERLVRHGHDLQRR